VSGPADVPTPSVMLAAMGPRMLELAGARTDGNILWLSGPRTIETKIRPALDAAATAAGRPAPRIVASVPVCVTDDPDSVKGLIATVLDGYNDLPSYRGVLQGGHLADGEGPEDGQNYESLFVNPLSNAPAAAYPGAALVLWAGHSPTLAEVERQAFGPVWTRATV